MDGVTLPIADALHQAVGDALEGALPTEVRVMFANSERTETEGATMYWLGELKPSCGLFRSDEV